MASNIPVYQSATAGQAALAGSINQLLGSHPSIVSYAAVLKASQTVNGAAHSSGDATTYWAQSFTTAVGQTTIGYVIAPIGSFTASGAALGTTTLSLYANSGGAPTGAPLVSTTITTEYADSVTSGTDTVQVTYPLPITGLTASTTYWLVLAPAGNGSNHYTWRQSNQVSGASSSTNGTTWAAQAFGLQYQIYDQTASGPPTCTYDDSGARWTVTYYNALGQISSYAEYTVGQTAAGYLQSYRTMTYSNGLLTKVA